MVILQSSGSLPSSIASPELVFTVVSARFSLNTTAASEVIDRLDSHLNWETVLQIAIAHRTEPLLYQALKQTAPERVPPQVMEQLQHRCRLSGLRNLVQTQKLLKLLALFEAQGIAAVPFKGPVLATIAYGNVSLRQFADLDILVQPQHFWSAKAVLNAQGYRSSLSKAQQRYSVKRDLQLCLSDTDEAGDYRRASIDLHWAIPPRRVLRLNALWNNLESIDLLGQKVKTFSTEAALVIQCLNVAKHLHSISFNQLCDVAQIVRAYPELDWNKCLEISAGLKIQRLFLLGLSYAHQLLQVPLPPLMLDKLVQLKIHQPAIEEIYGQIFLGQLRSEGALQIYRSFYKERLNHLDSYWDAGFVLLQFCYFLLDIILLPNDTDFEAVSLPTPLSYFYYPLHHLRILSKFVGFLGTAFQSIGRRFLRLN